MTNRTCSMNIGSARPRPATKLSCTARTKPIYAILLIIVLLELFSFGYWPAAERVNLFNSLFSYVTYLAAFVAIARSLPTVIVKSARLIYAPIILLVIGGYISMLWSTDQLATFRTTTKLFLLFSITLLFLVWYERHLIHSLANFALFFAISNLLAIVFVPDLALESIIETRAGTWKGLLPYKTSFGTYSAILAIYLISYMVFVRKNRSWFLTFGVLVLLMLVIGSGSRIAWISMFAGFSMMLFIRLYADFPPLLKASTFIIAFTISVGLAINGDALAEWGFRQLDRNIGLSNRDLIWAYVGPFIYDRPLHGYGVAVFFELSGVLSVGRLETGIDHFSTAHNSILEWALALGIPGAFLFCLAFALGLLRAFCLALIYGDRDIAVLLAAFITALPSLYVTSLGSTTSVHWFLLFFILAVPRKEREELR